jgi:hypothetical protein
MFIVRHSTHGEAAQLMVMAAAAAALIIYSWRLSNTEGGGTVMVMDLAVGRWMLAFANSGHSH